MADCFGDDLFHVFDDVVPTKKKKSFVKERKKKKSKGSAEKSESKNRLEKLLRSVNENKRKLDETEVDNGQDIKKTKEAQEDLDPNEYLPKVKIHTVETVEACTHEVAIPPDAEYVPLNPPSQKPHREYPFVLDPFQKEAILCLENNQSVLVSAHTSAGKTVVAEYAVAMSLEHKQRVIYTTPIKALSNQKYREFLEEFKDVGLMTGDVTINPTASCLIMTTEILRSMLYRGSEVTREVAWVVFDEIHYMRDKERGVVWEETIILLPDNTHYVFLSATIPNARQFAEWICHLHKQPCHVVYTDYRPVPLLHYIFPAGGEGLHLVVDDNGDFKEENFNRAITILQNAGDAAKGDERGMKNNKDFESNCLKVVKLIMNKEFEPVIVFSFSKKDCEAYAMQMSKLCFNTSDERTLVEEVFSNAMDLLSEEDRKLPQVTHVLPLLKKGIGIHHSGLLPILKETVEILFGEGLIKALFATETFAMGLNMPARTVVFTNAKKFDGKDFRWLTSGEYIQMSGRAGRRGLDDKGIVMLMVDEKMNPAIGKNLVKGQADPINSAFHLTYSMVLNLLRVEEINPEYMLERSFYQFQNYAAIPKLHERLLEIKQSHDSIVIPREDDVTAYYKLKRQFANLQMERHSFLVRPENMVPFLQAGRMVKVCNDGMEFDWGMVVKISRGKKSNFKISSAEAEPEYLVQVLLHVLTGGAKSKSIASVKPCPPREKGEMQIIPVQLQLITQMSSYRVNFSDDLRTFDNRLGVLKSIREICRRFPEGIPLLDPIDDIGIKDENFKALVKKMKDVDSRITSHPLHKDPIRDDLYRKFELKLQAATELQLARQELKKAKSLLQMDELKCRKRVLRRLGYCTKADVIETKGRIACEISSGDELLLTELLFNGVFNDLSPAQCAAMLSCFVFQENSTRMPKIMDELSGPLRQMQEMARHIAKVSIESRLEMEEETYVESFKPQLMDVIFAWAEGATFAQICKMTDVFEGSIIRCMRRLEELLRQMCQASKAIGNLALENKFAEGIRQIKRDIVFAASLYL